MSDVSDESDDDDWQYFEKVIGDRNSDDSSSTRSFQSSAQSVAEEVLNIDDFFGVEKLKVEPPLDCSFSLQRAIENSFSDSNSSSSCCSQRELENDYLTPTKDPFKESSLPSSSSSHPRHRAEQAVMKYHRSGDRFDIINLFSDEVLIRMLSLADYTTQRVCRRWSIIQIKVSRLKIVETLTTVSLLQPITAGQIEYELFQLCSAKLSKEFRQRARSLIFNLRGNDELRNRVSDGSLQPCHLVRMESSETATKCLVQQRYGNFKLCIIL